MTESMFNLGISLFTWLILVWIFSGWAFVFLSRREKMRVVGRFLFVLLIILLLAAPGSCQSQMNSRGKKKKPTVQVGTPPVAFFGDDTTVPITLATPYSFTITATGGIPPYTFSVASGVLPPGLSLSASGVISGTPLGPNPGDSCSVASDGTITCIYMVAFQVKDSLGTIGQIKVRFGEKAGG